METGIPEKAAIPCVLLADSDVEDREFFVNVMQMLHPNLPVLTFSNGQELLAYLGSCPGSTEPLCTVMAYLMPVIPAPEVLRKMSHLPRFENVMKVVWSDPVMEPLVSECIGLGASRFVCKPATLQEMQTLITSFDLGSPVQGRIAAGPEERKATSGT